MDIRWFPKLILWGMLTLACLGTVSSLLRPQTDPMPDFARQAQEQNMAIHTAVGFAREWMQWEGEELPEARLLRLKPYVNPDALVRIAAIQSEQKTNRQTVTAVDLVSLISDGPRYTVRVRVMATKTSGSNTERVIWEVDVTVWAQAGKGAAVTAPPLIRPVQEPPAVPKTGNSEESASGEVKQRMRPAIESFLKVMCEGKDADSLFNYVTAGAKIQPLGGNIRFLSLDRLDGTVAGTGSYTVTVTFSIKEEATEFRLTQEWKLAVTEENQKFFVSAIE